jgi:hypothetical protein
MADPRGGLAIPTLLSAVLIGVAVWAVVKPLPSTTPVTWHHPRSGE